MRVDYDFRFGAGRHLRGHGLNGLLALALLLAALLFIIQSAGAFTFAGIGWLRGLLFG